MKGSKKNLSGLRPDYLTDPWSGILIPAPPCRGPAWARRYDIYLFVQSCKCSSSYALQVFRAYMPAQRERWKDP